MSVFGMPNCEPFLPIGPSIFNIMLRQQADQVPILGQSGQNGGNWLFAINDLHER